MPMMSIILFWYMLRRYSQIVLLTILVLISCISFIEIIELLRRAGSKAPEISSFYLILVSLLNIPTILDQTLPFGVLFGSIICFYLWGRSHEFMVVRALGQNIWHALAPAIIAAFTLGCVHIIIINPIAATAAKHYNFTIKSLFGDTGQPDLSVLTNGIWIRDINETFNFIIKGDSLDAQKSIIFSPVIFQLDEIGRLSWQMRAKSMQLTEEGWLINNGIRIDNDGQTHILGNFTLPTFLHPSTLLAGSLPPKTVSIYQLPGFISIQKRAGLPVNQHLIFFYQLLSTPLKLVGQTLLAASFTLTVYLRQKKARLILLGLGAGFGVYFLSNLVYLLGNSAKLPYFLAGWGPAIIICLLGGVLLARTDE